MTLPVQVGPATITINRNDRILVCSPSGQISDDAEEGFFARDTRFVSDYRVLLNGRRPVLLNSSPIEFFSSRFEFTNDALVDPTGPIDEHTLSLRLDRTVAGGVHEDYDLVNYARRRIRLTIEIEIHSDFADIFDVKDHRLVRRGTVHSHWSETRREMRTRYVNQSFRREFVVVVERATTPPEFANGRLVFVAELPPRGTWHTCLHWLPVVEQGRRPAVLPCNAVTAAAGMRPAERWPMIRLETPNTLVQRAWEQAVQDMWALRLEDRAFGRGVVLPAAGVPYFVALFGRDALIVSLQSISAFPELAAGTLDRLATLQATADDPERDMEPGKIPHEIRNGELAALGILPYQPYYGTHDATSLFVIVLSQLYEWQADPALLRRYLPNAERAMRWIDHRGDQDGDGFQEYRTRSPRGYYNQGWKDAGDAIPAADGSLAPLPLALCELQGYAYDAKLRLAAIYETLDRPADAERLRGEAEALFERFNNAFWWESEGTYYLGLDGDKRPIETVASNAGHLLASGIVPPERAGRVVRRLLADDMWSGWGIRTLSSEHPAYNPFSYQTGSVWPHDNATIASGFRRYGFNAEAAQIARGLFEAAARFAANRLPELFAGLARDDGGFPVRYLAANVPQAWAASAVLRLIAVLCGIHARSDHAGSRIYVDPALPDWLPELTLHGLRAGRGTVSLAFAGRSVTVLSNTSRFRIVHGPPPEEALRPEDELTGADDGPRVTPG